MNFKINVNMRKIDILNARTASIPIEVNGDPAIVTGVCVIEGEGTDKQGNPCDVGYIATDKGVYMALSALLFSRTWKLSPSISQTALIMVKSAKSSLSLALQTLVSNSSRLRW